MMTYTGVQNAIAIRIVQAKHNYNITLRYVNKCHHQGRHHRRHRHHHYPHHPHIRNATIRLYKLS